MKSGKYGNYIITKSIITNTRIPNQRKRIRHANKNTKKEEKNLLRYIVDFIADFV